ncbi:MAG: hypothetical protein DRJ03_27465 [Chloroflexi bacterium]|nr:MAG: hypothetical protein DRI81_16015 [Chloroflexota bacterium]RLC77115.1 MAG: hypothetical protein DRJ03_27465 [Chloroflexota bacterium]
MTEKKQVQETSLESLSEDDLRRIILEVLATELRHIIRDEMSVILGRMPLSPQETLPATGTTPVSAAPDGFSVRPAGFWGTVKNTGRRVGQTAVGYATTPFTGGYGMATGDWRGLGWSTQQMVDGVAGSGTYNQMANRLQRQPRSVRQEIINQGYVVGWNIYCCNPNCRLFLVKTNNPAPIRTQCPQCGTIQDL